MDTIASEYTSNPQFTKLSDGIHLVDSVVYDPTSDNNYLVILNQNLANANAQVAEIQGVIVNVQARLDAYTAAQKS